MMGTGERNAVQSLYTWRTVRVEVKESEREVAELQLLEREGWKEDKYRAVKPRAPMHIGHTCHTHTHTEDTTVA